MDHSELLRHLTSRVDDIHSDLSEVQATNTDTNRKLTAEYDAARKQNILEWLSNNEPYNQHQNILQGKWEGTGKWILQTPEFLQWSDTDRTPKTLFCTGTPGVGKTTMASLVVENLLQTSLPDWPVAFVYFNYELKTMQTFRHVLRSMLRQIIQRLPGVPKDVEEMYERWKSAKGEPDSDDFKASIQAIASQLPGLWIVTDALDECDVQTRTGMLSLVSSLESVTNTKYLATCRFHLEPEVNGSSPLTGALPLEVRTSDDDIRLYIRSRFIDLDPGIYDEQDLPEQLVDRVTEVVHGV